MKCYRKSLDSGVVTVMIGFVSGVSACRGGSVSMMVIGGINVWGDYFT